MRLVSKIYNVADARWGIKSKWGWGRGVAHGEVGAHFSER